MMNFSFCSRKQIFSFGGVENDDVYMISEQTNKKSALISSALFALKGSHCYTRKQRKK